MALILFAMQSHSVLAAASTLDDVKLVINGVTVRSDVPPVIEKGRTLVPIRVISENLGADVGWDAASKRVTVKLGETEIGVVIGQDSATVNGLPVPLDVPGKIVKGRTLLPLRFVGEALGAEVGWEAQARTVVVSRPGEIKGIVFEETGGTKRLRLSTDGSAVLRLPEFAKEGRGADRLVIDLPYTVMSSALPPLSLQTPGIRFVRAGMVPADVPLTRILVDVDGSLAWQVHSGSGGDDIHIDFLPVVTDLRYRAGEGVYIAVEGTSPRIEALESPHRLVVHLPGAKIPADLAGLGAYSDGPVKAIRMETMDESARPGSETVGQTIVIELSEAVKYRVEEQGGSFLIRFLNPLKDISWVKSPLGGRLTLAAGWRPAFRVVSREKGYASVLLENTYIAFNAMPPGLPQGISVSESGDGGQPSGVTLDIRDKALRDINVGPQDGGQLGIELSMGELQGKTIVIDPGHGGSDPGAMSRSGTQEKVLVLQMAGRLKRLLEAAGARVLMTREDDTLVNLYERAGLANDAGADAFVSLHLNSSVKSTIKGYEVYYYEKSEEDLSLARHIYMQMARRLEGAGRGIQPNDFVVVRETQMASVLVEAAYLSNPEEERMAKTEDFQATVAEAILNGLVEFFRSRSTPQDNIS